MTRRPDDQPEREVVPDLAALDELMRAFDIEVDPVPSVGDPRHDDIDDTDDIDDIDDTDDAEEISDEIPDEQGWDEQGWDDDPAAAPQPGVIAIADDELPDAVYVEGDLGGPGKRGRRNDLVFIDDDGAADLEPLDDESGPTRIEPRLRDRREAVRRAADRKRNRWIVVVGVVLLVIVGALAVLGSPLFSVSEDNLTVTGAVYTDRQRLDAVIDDLVGTPTLIVDTRALELELESIAWVDTARVRTRFPRSASIEIRERSALATFRGPDGRFRVIDREGRVLDVIEGQPIAYMLITGPDALDIEQAAFAPVGYAAAAELVQALTPSVRGRVMSVDVTGDGSQLRLLLEGGVEVRFGAADDLLVKLVRLENVLDRAIDERATVIDVSTAEVTVR